MKLRTKYLLFIFFLHGVTLVLTFFIFKENKWLFFVSEVFILFSLWLAWGLYRELLQPLQSLMTGVEAIRDQDFSVKFRPTGKHEMDELIAVYNHMIDRLRQERTQQEEQHFFLEKLVATAPTGILLLNFDQHIEQVNPKALELLGLSEEKLLGKILSAVQHPLLQQAAMLTSGQVKTVTVNGAHTYRVQVAHFTDRGFARRFMTIEELTTEISTAEKNVYEKIIRMMAHEVNNTVGPVNSILQSAVSDRGAGLGSAAFQKAFQVAMQRNSNLNQFMRNFADLVKLPQPQLKQSDLCQLLHHTATLFSIQAGIQNIRFVFSEMNAPFIISADEQQMEQVLINIVKNSIEAIGADGSISFRINRNQKRLLITDTGKGIARADADHLFSPFFSTKKDGQGVGLMLVREVLRNHGFTFSLQTTGERQTVFTISFGT